MAIISHKCVRKVKSSYKWTRLRFYGLQKKTQYEISKDLKFVSVTRLLWILYIHPVTYISLSIRVANTTQVLDFLIFSPVSDIVDEKKESDF